LLKQAPLRSTCWGHGGKSTASFTDRSADKGVTPNDIQKSFDVIFEIEAKG